MGRRFRETREGVAVVVKDGLIDAVLPVSEVPAGVETAALPECTLLPGLMDAHVHYSSVMGPAFLAAGGDHDPRRGQRPGMDPGRARAPRKGPLRRSRHPVLRPPARRAQGLLAPDGPRPRHARRDRRIGPAARGSRGGPDQAVRGVDPPLLKAAVEAAHASGRFVVAHLQATTAEDAARLGLDEFEHLAGCGVAWRAASEAEDDLVIDLLLERDVIIDPTLVVWDRLGRILDRPFHHDARRTWVHPRHLDLWQRYLNRFGPPEHRWRYQAPWST